MSYQSLSNHHSFDPKKPALLQAIHVQSEHVSSQTTKILTENIDIIHVHDTAMEYTQFGQHLTRLRILFPNIAYPDWKHLLEEFNIFLDMLF